LASIPVLHQLNFVQRRPLDNESVSAAWQRSVNDIQSGDVVLRFVLAVEGMKMRWWVIIPIHPNEDAEEFADRGHIGVLGLITANIPLI
jgi:hypothetical protein